MIAQRKQFASTGIDGLRWWIAGLIFLATLINFVNRLTISVLAPVITEQLKLSNLEFASITNSFLLAYTVSQALSGKLYDRVGNRRGFTISIVVWSVASMLHAFATGLFSLNCFRFLLGLGEAGNWPGAAKVIAEWFPIRQRALGMAIFNSGTSIGSVVAPPVIIALQLRFGWQATFLAVGALGFLWLVLWLAFYHPPDQHPRITPEEFALIREDRGPAAARLPWLELLRYRQTWAIVLSRFCCDPVWWLYITWLPLYLYKVHGFSLKQIGLFAWVPYVAADAGSLFGGWMSGHLISRGMEHGSRAEIGHRFRHVVHVCRVAGRRRAHGGRGAGGDRGGALRVSDVDQQRADTAERLFSGERGGFGRGPGWNGRGDWGDSVYPDYRDSWWITSLTLRY